MPEANQAHHETCPNCGGSVIDHPEDGCVLAALMTVLRDRGTHDQAALQRIHAQCDVESLWRSVDALVDQLAEGRFDRE